MDLFIHSLTGTVFELRVSPFETILSIKAKIQRLEGIPISQQHLIWRSIELEDELCLHDYVIKSGATLTLVLAMRDGPINMRRVSVEEPSMQEVAEYMDANRDEIWDKLMNDNKQVTLLVFRDGDQLNFFRVYDRGDGTLSPYSDSISPNSIYNVCEDDETVHGSKEKQEEHSVTKDKMKVLRQQIAAKCSKIKHPPRPPSARKPSSKLAKRRIQFSTQPPRSIVSRHGVIPKTESKMNHYDCVQITPSPEKLDETREHSTRHTLPPVSGKGKHSSEVDISDIMSSRSEDIKPASSMHSNIVECNTSQAFSTSDRASACSSNLQKNRRLPSLDERKHSGKRSREKSDLQKSSRTRRHILKPLGTVDKNNASGFLSELKSPQVENKNNTVLRGKDASDCSENIRRNSRDLDDILKESQLPEILRDPAEFENYRKLLNWVHPKTGNIEEEHVTRSGKGYRPLSRNRRKIPDGRMPVRVHSGKIHPHGNFPHLPPVHNEKRHPPTLTGKKKTRCAICTKKLGLATTYQCRCGSTFCASHRYPETHTCTYDYKSEGRKLLEKSNPVVTAPKLPKI